jgi:hypothetical protein
MEKAHAVELAREQIHKLEAGSTIIIKTNKEGHNAGRKYQVPYS